MAQRDTVPEVTELQHCLLGHLIGKSIPSCSFPQARRQSITDKAASYPKEMGFGLYRLIIPLSAVQFKELVLVQDG